jgi:hypothetical protein
MADTHSSEEGNGATRIRILIEGPPAVGLSWISIASGVASAWTGEAPAREAPGARDVAPPGDEDETLSPLSHPQRHEMANGSARQTMRTV